MRKLSDWVLRHKLFVAIFWFVLAVAGFASLGTATSRLSTNFSVPNEPAFKADARVQALFHSGGDVAPTVLSIEVPPGTSWASPLAEDAVGRAFGAAGHAVPGSRVLDAATTGDERFYAGRYSFAVVFTPPGAGQFGGNVPTAQLESAVTRALPKGWQVAATGLAQLESGAQQKGPSVLAETMIGGLGALAVLAFVFASLLALMPLIMAVIAIPATFLLIDGLTYLTPVNFIVEFLVALIGLGVSIDYSLLVVTRWREQRAKGDDNETAVKTAMASAGRAVVFSGLTVAISLLALVVLPVNFLRNIGSAGFLIPLVSVGVATTLLPVLLATVGPRLDWPRIRKEARPSRVWSSWARLVVNHKGLVALLGTGAALALVFPLTNINIGEPQTSALATSGPAHAALVELSEAGVPTGIVAPIEILTTAKAAPTAARALSVLPGIYGAFAPSGPGWHRGATALVEVLPVNEPSSSAGSAAVTAVREAARQLRAVTGVGGIGPSQQDFSSSIYGNFPLMLALIAIATFLLLARAFRSVVLATKAVVFNLLSVSAAYGTMVLIWQSGYGSRLIWGIPATGSITVWVPIMVFAFLFGLSMDYEVFILSRTREAYDTSRDGSTTEAVVTGLARTGRLVTSAAAILFLSFLSMSSAPDTDVKVLATGLGAGILLDAVLVRSVLVPAYISLLGRWNWWLPAPLARLLFTSPSRLPAATN
ncbi:MAG TPA: MMPL family transporter [Acidimicrobiales bacterium]|nr:MMPL family transporter [Acidimicrobiales bacterium]